MAQGQARPSSELHRQRIRARGPRRVVAQKSSQDGGVIQPRHYRLERFHVRAWPAPSRASLDHWPASRVYRFEFTPHDHWRLQSVFRPAGLLGGPHDMPLMAAVGLTQQAIVSAPVVPHERVRHRERFVGRPVFGDKLLRNAVPQAGLEIDDPLDSDHTTRCLGRRLENRDPLTQCLVRTVVGNECLAVKQAIRCCGLGGGWSVRLEYLPDLHAFPDQRLGFVE